MTAGEHAELKRIADALEKIAAMLTTPMAQVQQTYEPAPYWQNPNWTPPEVK